MERLLQILIIEDHPSMVENYKTILQKSSSNIVTTVVTNCESAYFLLFQSNLFFDIILLDILLPDFSEKGIDSGEKLGFLIKQNLPKSKLIILTSLSQTLFLYSIYKEIKPEGILIKSDFSGEEMLEAFEIVKNGSTFYSETVKNSIAEIKSKANYLDNCNRQILFLLNKGVKTKSLPDHLNLSLSAIDKRKNQIKEYFGIDKGNDEDILREARRIGYL